MLQAVHAVDAALAGQLAHTVDALVGWGAAAGAGGKVHLAFGVLVHQAVWVDLVSSCLQETMVVGSDIGRWLGIVGRSALETAQEGRVERSLP